MESRKQYTDTVTVTKEGVAPLATYTYTANDGRSPEYYQNFDFTAPEAPAAPAPQGPVVSDVVVSNLDSTWTGNKANGGNVQETYILSYKINGISLSQDLSTYFTKNGTGLGGSQDLTYNATYNNQTVIVHYTLNFVMSDSKGDNTTNP